jgi:hypothetical protein
MGNWTVKKVPITAVSEDVEEHEGRIEGQGSVMLDDCPFKQEVTDETLSFQTGSHRRNRQGGSS